MTPTDLTELDRMLAEFMGVCMGTLGRWDSELCGMLCAGCSEVVQGGTEGGPHHSADWHPTSDIEQAMQVAEKIGGLELVQLHNGDWMAKFGSAAINYWSKTAPHAVASAAKSWLSAQPTATRE